MGEKWYLVVLILKHISFSFLILKFDNYIFHYLDKQNFFTKNNILIKNKCL